jgi:hypothetical protein
MAEKAVMEKKLVENSYVSFWIEDGILYGLYKKDVVIGLEAAREVVALRKKFTNGQAYPAIAFIKHVKVISKEARKYLAEEGSELITKGALVSDSGFSKILGNMFLALDKPKMPTRIFTNVKEAIAWLKYG